MHRSWVAGVLAAVLCVGGIAFAEGIMRPPYEAIDFYFVSVAGLPGEIRAVSVRCGCGLPTVVEEQIAYTSGGRIGSFCFHPSDPKLIFVRPASGTVWVVHFAPFGPLPEWALYEHPTPIGDLVFVCDEAGEHPENPRAEWHLYFSEAHGKEGDGLIYRLGWDGTSTPVYEVRLSDVGGYWDGNFGFSPDGTLYVSSGDRLPGRLFRLGEQGFEEVYRDNEDRIAGFVFLDPYVLLYANLDGKVYRVDLRSGTRTLVYLSRGRFRIADVVLPPDEWGPGGR